MSDYKTALTDIYTDVQAIENRGSVASYIPELAKVNPDSFGASLLIADGAMHSIGDSHIKFSIQSIAKVLTLSLAYQLLGESIWQRVGVEPSGTAFNSLVQLETDHGIPRNPLINGGAMVICDMLLSILDNPKSDFLKYVREVSGCEGINYSISTAESEAAIGYRNRALCNFIKSYGNNHNEPDEVLDFYFHICAIEMTCQELVQAFRFLTFSNYRTVTNSSVLTLQQAKRINAIMQMCGFYDESGEFSFKVGLPGKSGVGGGIVALHPEKCCVAVWSPRLNDKGNSHKGMKFLELFTTKTQLSIF